MTLVTKDDIAEAVIQISHAEIDVKDVIKSSEFLEELYDVPGVQFILDVKTIVSPDYAIQCAAEIAAVATYIAHEREALEAVEDLIESDPGPEDDVPLPEESLDNGVFDTDIHIELNNEDTPTYGGFLFGPRF